VLNIWRVELRELCPASSAVVVIPMLARSSVVLQLKSYAPEVPSVVDPPLLVWIISHAAAPMSLGTRTRL